MSGVFLRSVETFAIVTDCERQRSVCVVQREFHPRCVRMSGDVVQSFLGNAVEGFFHIERQVWFGVEVRDDIQFVASPQGVGLFGQRGDQSFILKQLGTQLEDKRAHFGESRFGKGENVIERFRQSGGSRSS